MIPRIVRNLAIAGGVAAVIFACSAQAPACAFLDRLFGGCGCPEPAPAYGAAYAPGCSTCPTPCASPCSTYAAGYAPSCAPVSTVAYRPVPTTRYSFRLVREPVTSYRPVVTTDPCSGCQTTAYQPVTDTRLRFRWVPYTTYRYQPVANGVASTSCYSPWSSCTPCGTSAGCGSFGSSCFGGSCAGGSNCASGDCGGTTTYNGGSSSTDLSSPPPKTFQDNSQPAEQRELKPIPESGSDTQSFEPRLILPENNTTTRPAIQSGEIRLVSSTATVLPPATTRPVPLEYNGWRPASD